MDSHVMSAASTGNGNTLSENFTCSVGVRQACTLCPSLDLSFYEGISGIHWFLARRYSVQIRGNVQDNFLIICICRFTTCNRYYYKITKSVVSLTGLL